MIIPKAGDSEIRSCNQTDVAFGTLGCVLQPLQPEGSTTRYLLTCGHVLRRSGQLDPGTDVCDREGSIIARRVMLLDPASDGLDRKRSFETLGAGA